MYIINITKTDGKLINLLSTTKSVKNIINSQELTIGDEVQIYDIVGMNLLKDFYIKDIKQNRNKNFCLIVRHSNLKEEIFKMYWEIKLNKYQYKR